MEQPQELFPYTMCMVCFSIYEAGCPGGYCVNDIEELLYQESLRNGGDVELTCGEVVDAADIFRQALFCRS